MPLPAVMYWLYSKRVANRMAMAMNALNLLELGVMKRLLQGWMTGNMACPRWHEDQIAAMNARLAAINTPREIHHGARSLALFRLWKGQEFRNFLNYDHTDVLREHLPKKYYEHFLLLFCGVRLASSDAYLLQFVNGSPAYGCCSYRNKNYNSRWPQNCTHYILFLGKV